MASLHSTLVTAALATRAPMLGESFTHRLAATGVTTALTGETYQDPTPAGQRVGSNGAMGAAEDVRFFHVDPAALTPARGDFLVYGGRDFRIRLVVDGAGVWIVTATAPLLRS